MRPLNAMLIALLTGAGAASATAQDLALGAKAGTTGVGMEITLGMTEAVNLRGGIYGLDYGRDFEESGIDYDGDLKLRSAALLLDWHPGGRGFRVTAGAYANGNELRGRAEGNLDIGDSTYDVRLDAKADWDRFAPYLGIGYGNAVRGGPWSFSFDAGVMFTGSPDVRLSADGPGTGDPGFQDDLRREEQSLEDELSDLEYYPVLSLGLSYRF